MSNNIFEKLKQEPLPFEIFPGQKDYSFIKHIAHGNYGIVDKVIGKHYIAMKEIDIGKISKKDGEPFHESLENAYNEYLIMKKKSLKNVVRAHDCFYSEKEKKFYFTMDIMEGSLELFMETLGNAMTFEEFLPKFQDMVTG